MLIVNTFFLIFLFRSMMKMAECEVRVVDERDGTVLLSGLFISHCLLSLPMVESERLQPSCTEHCTTLSNSHRLLLLCSRPAECRPVTVSGVTVDVFEVNLEVSWGQYLISQSKVACASCHLGSHPPPPGP